MTNTSPAPLWRPDASRIADARITDYQRWLSAEKGLAFDDYQSLWTWSVEHLEDFYESLWRYFDIRHSAPLSGCWMATTCPAPNGSKAPA